MAFSTDCSELVKMTSSPSEWHAFSMHLDEFVRMRDEFSFFSRTRDERRTLERRQGNVEVARANLFF